MTNKADSKEKERSYRYFIYIILFLIVIIFFLIIIGNQNSIMMMQTQIVRELSDKWVEYNFSSEDTEHKNKADDNISSIKNPTDNYALTPDERDLVQRIVAAEAREEDLQGQMAVAQTILDRAVYWNMAVTEVIISPGQYADPYQGPISDSVKLAVINVFDGGMRVFNDPVTHFYSGDDPCWAEEKVKRGNIGKHTFCY